MTTNRTALLCRYQYDALDRLVGHAQPELADAQRFYYKSRLITEIQGAVRRTVFQHGDQLLAEKHYQDSMSNTLFATDRQRSVLQAINATESQSIAYTPYGHTPAGSGLNTLLGFNSERRDPVTGHYLLGNGYRAFNPVLMRFNSPDYLSPFGKGGLNAYAYCLGDPINRQDPNGHFSTWLPGLINGLKFINKHSRTLLKATSKRARPAMENSTQLASNSAMAGRFKNAPILKNLVPEDVGKAYMYSESIQEFAKKPLITTLTKYDDFQSLKGADVKFILTKQGQFVIGQPSEFFTASHPTLSQHASTNRVISAGYLLHINPPKISIDNVSGHYKPSGQTLDYADEFLTSLGMKVTQIRRVL